MEWIVRFTMGLRPRKQDIEQLKNLLPELFEQDSFLSDSEIFVFPFPPFRRIDISLLKEWVKSEPVAVETTSSNVSSFICPLANYLSNEDPNKLSMLTRGFVNNRGFVSITPKKSFFDLVTKIHKGNHTVKDVIITDRFIYSDEVEDGTPGGYENVIEYLKKLLIESNEEFTIVTNPHAKL